MYLQALHCAEGLEVLQASEGRTLDADSVAPQDGAHSSTARSSSEPMPQPVVAAAWAQSDTQYSTSRGVPAAQPATHSDSTGRPPGWVLRTFGVGWHGLIGNHHRLMAAEPLLYCDLCGKHASSVQHLSGLRADCLGKPDKTGAARSRLNFIRRGLMPLVPHTPLKGSRVALRKPGN